MVASSLRAANLRQKQTITVNMCYLSPDTERTIRFANRKQVTEMYKPVHSAQASCKKA
jgi:hypothetical protein